MWDRLIKNKVRGIVFGFFKGARFNTFLDITGEGCRSTIEAHKKKVILKKSLLLWAEHDVPIGKTISSTLKSNGFNNTISHIGNITAFRPNMKIDMVNLDLMSQISEELILYIRDHLDFSDGGGFSITVHHHDTRVKSRYAKASDTYYRNKRFDECFNGTTIKYKPHQFSGVVNEPVAIRYTDLPVNSIYGLLSKVAFYEYDFNLETIIIYGEKKQENNMVTFVFSGITKRTNKGEVASRKAHATTVIKGIRKLM